MDFLKKGVLIVSPFFSPNIGGVETHLDNLCAHLAKNNYLVYVITYQPITTSARGIPAERKGNLEIRRLDWPGFGIFHKLERYPIFEFLYITPGLLVATFMFLIFNKDKIDVMHAHGFNAAFIARLVKVFFKKHTVVSTHSIYNLSATGSFSRILRWTLNGADKVLAVSRPSKDELERIGVDREKVTVYTYWVDQDIFRPLDKQESKRTLGREGKFIVLFVGRFLEKKGVRILIEAAGITKNALFVFVGDGPMRQEIENAAKGNAGIVLAGRVPNEKLPVYYSAADVVCVPSLYDEAFGRVIAESLSCGVPVIASNRGAIPDVLDKSVGVLAEPNAAETAAAINQLRDNPAQLESLGRNCRDFAVRRFGEKNAEIITNAYNDKETFR